FQVVGETNARREVVPVGADPVIAPLDSQVRDLVNSVNQIRIVQTALQRILLSWFQENFIAQTRVERQFASYLPIVLEEETALLQYIVPNTGCTGGLKLIEIAVKGHSYPVEPTQDVIVEPFECRSRGPGRSGRYLRSDTRGNGISVTGRRCQIRLSSRQVVCMLQSAPQIRPHLESVSTSQPCEILCEVDNR